MADHLSAGDIALVPTSGSDSVLGFAAERNGERIGTVAFLKLASRHGEASTRSVRWNLGTLKPLEIVSVLDVLIGQVFATTDTERIETRVPSSDHSAIRTASIAGMRREGTVRVPGGNDLVQLARLADDPPLSDRNGFIAVLNAGLARKRVIGQGVLRDAQGRVLLCELTYKKDWDLPGGVIENGESPAVGLARELAEELGHDFAVGELITMNWLPAWRAWDDACVFVFDLGEESSSFADSLVLQPNEIAAVHWCDDKTVRERATDATIELLSAISAGSLPGYREAPKAPE